MDAVESDRIHKRVERRAASSKELQQSYTLGSVHIAPDLCYVNIRQRLHDIIGGVVNENEGDDGGGGGRAAALGIVGADTRPDGEDDSHTHESTEILHTTK